MSKMAGDLSRLGEETPLLREQRREGSENGSEETLTNARGSGDEEIAGEDEDKANQLVGRGRGFLIILSLWGLIFLQGNVRSGTTFKLSTEH